MGKIPHGKSGQALVDSPSLKGFKKRVDVTLWNMVLHGWLDLMILKIFSNLNNSTILCLQQLLPPLLSLVFPLPVSESTSGCLKAAITLIHSRI